MACGQKTGGRQRGTPNKATIEREIRAAHGVHAAVNGGVLPLDILLARMRDEPLPNGEKPTDAQFEAAVAAAPYLHPRLAATTLKASVTLPVKPPIDTDQLTDEQREVLHSILLLTGATPELQGPQIDGETLAAGPGLIEGKLTDGYE
jgi:hypothetical protein